MLWHQYLGLHARDTGTQNVTIHQAGKNILGTIPGQDFLQLFPRKLLPSQERIDLRRIHRHAPDRRTAAGQCQQQHGIDIHHLGQAVAQLFQDIAFRQVHLEDRVQLPVAVFIQAHGHQQTDRRLRLGLFVVAEQVVPGGAEDPPALALWRCHLQYGRHQSNTPWISSNVGMAAGTSANSQSRAPSTRA
ncbi:hypothetical protein FQZ97_776440 [compost metagenome]